MLDVCNINFRIFSLSTEDGPTGAYITTDDILQLLNTFGTNSNILKKYLMEKNSYEF